jgi:hypothetical protein
LRISLKIFERGVTVSRTTLQLLCTGVTTLQNDSSSPGAQEKIMKSAIKKKKIVKFFDSIKWIRETKQMKKKIIS